MRPQLGENTYAKIALRTHSWNRTAAASLRYTAQGNFMVSSVVILFARAYMVLFICHGFFVKIGEHTKGTVCSRDIGSELYVRGLGMNVNFINTNNNLAPAWSSEGAQTCAGLASQKCSSDLFMCRYIRFFLFAGPQAVFGHGTNYWLTSQCLLSCE